MLEKVYFGYNVISCCRPERSQNNIRPRLLRRPQQIQSWGKEFKKRNSLFQLVLLLNLNLNWLH